MSEQNESYKSLQKGICLESMNYKAYVISIARAGEVYNSGLDFDWVKALCGEIWSNLHEMK
jgi:hypothetical protein